HRAEDADQRARYERSDRGAGASHVPAEPLAGSAYASGEQLGKVRRKSAEAADGKEAIERHEPRQGLDGLDLSVGEQAGRDAADNDQEITPAAANRIDQQHDSEKA